MRPTRLGWGCLAMTALTLLTAASTGNNLLYLLYSALSAALLVAAVGGKRNLRKVAVTAQPRGQAFRGQSCTAAIMVRNESRAAVHAVDVLWQGTAASIAVLPAGGSESVLIKGILPHRGLNELTDLAVESGYPLNLFRFRRRGAAATVLALPRPHEVREARELGAEVRASGRPTLRKGAGDELYGIREFGPGDDARLLNWKLTARTGRPVVNEFCAAHDDRITVTAQGGRGEAAERAIEEAASACRYHIDAGAEVRLETPERTVDYGRGLLQLDRLLRALAVLGDGATARPSGEAPAWRSGHPEVTPALRRLTLAGAALTFAGMFLVDEVSVRLLVLCSPALLLGAVVQERGWRLLPRLAWDVLSVAVLCYTLLVDWRVSGVTVSNTHLLLYLLVNRVLTPLKREELGQFFLILFLAFFLISGLTISLWYFALLLGYLAFAGCWLMLASGLPWARRREWLPALGGALLACALAAAALFAATPRVEGLRRINPFLAAGIDKLSVQNSAVTGFSDGITLGFFGRLKKSSARVMRVKPNPPFATERPGELHVRGAAFDLFDGKRWAKTPSRRIWAARQGDTLHFPAAPPPRGARTFEITVYPMNVSAAFTVGTPYALEAAEDNAWFDETDSVAFAAAYQGGTRYRVRPSAALGLGDDGPNYAPPARFLAVPADPDGRVGALAREATQGAGDAEAKIHAVERFLRKRYDYSLYSESKNPGLEEFLFKTRKGNCEYFATAGAVLLRHAGVPTRVVTGFLAADWNEYGKFYDVRQAEAHAWVEAFVPGKGWMTTDPTPPQSLLAAGAEEIGRKIQHWFAALQTEWYRHVIGYDQYVQRDTFRKLGSALSPRALERAARGAASMLLGFALVWALAAGLPLLRERLRRGPRPAFQRAQEALARAGLGREPAWTAREFAAAVVGRRPELAPIAALAELHYLDRFCPAGLSADQAAEAERLVDELRRVLARKA